MPFELCNAPATFQRLMQAVLSGLEWRVCFVYLDDILVCSRSFQEHLQHLNLVIERLRRAGLTLKPQKCYFLQREVHYLGHLISHEGIAPDPAKTEKVREFPIPTDVTKVRQFVGLASYYRRFVPGFARIATPLHALTKKEVALFHWTEECQAAFDRLKELLITSPVLAYPQFGPGKEFVLETDASLEGLGAVLSQRQTDGYLHPIAYASRCLQPHERNYAITELETLGLVWAAKLFRPYLLGYHCIAFTDHSACTSLLNAAHPSGKLARWAMVIQELDIEIRHRPGKANSNADALSRNPVPLQTLHEEAAVLSVESMSQSGSPITSDSFLSPLREITEHQRKDPNLFPIICYLEKGTLPDNERESRRLVLESFQYDMVDGVLHSENPVIPGSWRVVVPKELRQSVLEEAHGGRFAGHFSEKRIYETLRKKFWWKGMRADTRRHCRFCLVCASRKGTGRASHAPLQSILVGGPFHRVGVDVLQFPLTEAGNRYVVVFLDYLTKWAEAFPSCS